MKKIVECVPNFMADIKDEGYKTRILSETEGIASRARKKCAEVLDILDSP